MSTPIHPPNEEGAPPPTLWRLPPFSTFEQQLSRSEDHGFQLAPINRSDHPLPPRLGATQLHPDSHWQEYRSQCNCSSDHHAPPGPIPMYPYAAHRLPSSPPSRHTAPQHLMASSSRHPSSSFRPPSPPPQSLYITSSLPSSSRQPPSPHSRQPSTPPEQRTTPPSPPRNHRRQGGTLRPRWTPSERLELFKAVSRDKELEEMSTFHWDIIAQQVGRSRKSCKDQWRREIYRTMLDIFEQQKLSNRNIVLGSRERDHDSMEEDSEQDTGNMDIESD
ncbi:hypothetical protein BJV82DRAFT_343685 [Fennellomyces sp. T-0311]|nr:hypothetical protein BJV82DRAFT_343685 [Fennellomyces sp. T-0311]